MRLSLFFTAILITTAIAGCLGNGSKGDGLPVANFKVTPINDVTFLFDATNSSDPDGDQLMVAWNFGDEGIQTGSLNEYGLIEYEYAVTNTAFWVTLVVRDDDGHASSYMEQVMLGTGVNAPPEIHLKNATRWVAPGSAVTLDASQSDDHDEDFFSYEWTLGTFTDQNVSIDSGLLMRGQSFNHTFDTVGVYDFHCHPHPWMTSRVVVGDEDPNATDGGTIMIANYTYEPKTFFVRPGSTVRWVNDDPEPHTATLGSFAPGKVVHTGPVFSTRLEEAGDYQVRLTLNDGKGGHTSQTWGLRASEDAPPSPEMRTIASATVNHVEGAQGATWENREFAYRSNWTANLTVTVSWEDQQNSGSVSIVLLDPAGKVVTGCVRDGAQCTLQYNIEPGTYKIRASADGVLVQNGVTITSSAIQYTFPSFGDSAGCPPGWDLHGGVCMKH